VYRHFHHELNYKLSSECLNQEQFSASWTLQAATGTQEAGCRATLAIMIVPCTPRPACGWCPRTVVVDDGAACLPTTAAPTSGRTALYYGRPKE